MSTALDQPNRTRDMWLACLSSAFRAALACIIVGATTLYGPSSFRHQVAFPAFSYVTVILVATDATLGDTLRGCWLALYATFQTLGPAILSLWLIGPSRLTCGTTAVAVALAAFVVAVPESSHVVCKRIALGQIVITYVIAFIQGQETEAVMHPIHVAASTGVGVLACVLALLVPFPRLATNEVKQNCKSLAENTSEGVKFLVKAFCAEDKSSAFAYISKTKPLCLARSKLLQNIKRYQESMQWERLPFNFLASYYLSSGGKLQDLEIPLKGMEMALNSCSFPVAMLDEQLRNRLNKEEELVSQNLKQATSCIPAAVPEPNADNKIEFHQTLQSVPATHKELASFFFLFCLKLLQSKSLAILASCKQSELIPEKEQSNETCKHIEVSFKGVLNSWTMGINCRGLIPAFKCSLSLGLAIFFGSVYSKEDGFWAGLPVAISHAVAREATFKVSNVKFQGTVLGTVYGVLGCFLFHKFLPIRFLSLIPWFVFSSFLRQSKMYGQAGAISAVIGAVLILGRKNFGPPKDFAIARIVETFIGLSCSIMVELLFQPKRAATLAKLRLSRSLAALQDCVGLISLHASKDMLEENQTKLRTHLNELRKFIGEAEVEPNFWFLPFPSACYSKLLGSLSRMRDLLLLCADASQILEKELHKFEASWKEGVNNIEGEIQQVRKSIESTIKCVGEVASVKSLTTLEQELERKSLSYDLEMGKSPNPIFPETRRRAEDDVEKMISSYLHNSQETVDKIKGVESEAELKSEVVLGLTALGFCLSSLMRETRAIEEGIKEVLQWENPSSNTNLNEISFKAHAVQK